MFPFSKKSLITVLVAAPIVAFAGTDRASESARDLYFQPTKALFASNSSATTIASNQRAGENFNATDNGGLGGIGGYYEKLDNPGVSYKIELLRRGSNTPKVVSASHVFKSGDRIRIHVSSNADGYMHALHKGSSGNVMLVPASAGGRVINGQTVVIPSANGWMKFDDQKGVEKLEFVFASAPDASSNGLIPTAGDTSGLITAIQQASLRYSNSKSLVTYENSGEKDLIIEGGSNALTPVVVNRTQRQTAQIEQAVYQSPANYLVNTAGEPVVVKIALKHQ